MSKRPACYEELTRLVSALLDDRLTAEEMSQLQALLQQDATARQLYLQLVDQEIEFACLVNADTTNVDSHIVPLSPAEGRERKLPLSQRLLALAALIVLLAVVAIALRAPLGWRGTQEAKSSKPIPSLDAKSDPEPPPIADNWSEDFEKGTSEGWTGTLFTNDLPAGSRFGIAAVPIEYPGEVAYGIKLPEEWKRGFLVITQRSTLHVTYRLKSSKGLNVFMHTLSAKPAGKQYEMYHLPTSRAFRSGGEWQTTSVPLSEFRRKVRVGPAANLEFAGGPPEAGERATTLVFSWPDPLDFAIDRIWITPDGPGQDPM